MNYLLRYFFLIYSLILSCHLFGQKHILISGTFEGVPDSEFVYIKSDRGYKDSALIQNGKFDFNLDAPSDEWDIYFVNCPKASLTYMFPLFAAEGSVLNFTVNKAMNHVIIKGDKIANEQNSFYEGFFLINDRYNNIQNKINRTKNPSDIQRLNRQLKKVENEISNYLVNWVFTHKNSPFSVAVIFIYISKPYKKTEDTLAEKCFDSLSPDAINNNYQSYILLSSFAKYNYKYILYLSNMQALNSLGDSVFYPERKLAPDFVIQDTSGNGIQLKDFKGEILLIDFWASWCMPCRINNPLLKKLYDKYHGKGLALLSISLDIDKESWKKAIVQDKMDWYNGSDLMGPGKGLAEKYQVSAIPTYFLVEPGGYIKMVSIGGYIKPIEIGMRQLFDK